ncbi:unnamed protein product [Menidia menidia]|uniref:(Atlantic silverside) hypothetical protein n=1 Tax=Menidia menidia TaxID=238744 RepID=A0A8S4APE9_9TELE|nr:unnamed protein product [Menidia menidia]
MNAFRWGPTTVRLQLEMDLRLLLLAALSASFSWAQQENGRKCSNISIGDEVYFDISVETQKCPSKGKSETITIKPLGFKEEVEVTLDFICDCECAAAGEAESQRCSSGNGTYECGACK